MRRSSVARASTASGFASGSLRRRPLKKCNFIRLHEVNNLQGR